MSLHAYISKTVSRTKSHWMTKHPWPFDYKMQCSDSLDDVLLDIIALDLKATACVRRPKVCRKTPKIEFFGGNDRLSETFRNSVPKEFMTTPIHVLCSNFEQIWRRKVDETKRCFGDKV